MAVDRELRTARLELSDFTRQANVANIDSPIAEFVIPRGWCYLFPNDKPILVYITGKETFTVVSGQNIKTLTNPLSDPPVLPDDGGAAVAFQGATRRAISAINYATKAVTIEGCVADSADIYYLIRDGYLKIQVEAPRGAGTIAKVLFNDQLDRINTINQFDRRTALLLKSWFQLPHDFKLKVYVITAATVNIADANAINARIQIPYHALPIYKMPADIEDKVIALMSKKV